MFTLSSFKKSHMAMFNGSTHSLPKSQIEAMRSVVPLKVSDPKLCRRVTAADFRSGSSIFRRRLHVVLYYNKASDEDTGWSLAGWMQESLGRALEEQPWVAGRLRRRGEERGGGGEGGLEIVSNDSGVRLLEARICKSLAEFIELKEREEDAEAELVFWKDIDGQNPQFSSLFYVQVTNFQCGGYSIGISYSLLLANPFDITSFIKKWSTIHKNLIADTSITKFPLHYLPKLKSIASNSFLDAFASDQDKFDRGRTLIFTTVAKRPNPIGEMHKVLVLQCAEEAENKIDVKLVSKFFLIAAGELSGEIVVEEFAREEIAEKSPIGDGGRIVDESLDDLGINEVIFCGGNKPTNVSYWINSVSDEGLAILIPSPEESASEIKVIVTLPNRDSDVRRF